MLNNSIFSDDPVATTSSDCNVSNDEQVFCGGFVTEQFRKAKTQKAKGIFFLQEEGRKVMDIYGWRVPKHILFEAGFKFEENSFNFPVFIRPCPTVPKHGFVDSVVCNNASELNSVSNETYNVENTAELLVTKPVDSSFNAIINGGTITFAPGNDGATSGKGVQYFYINDDPLSEAIGLDKNILLNGEVPFYEMVFSKRGESSLVQVRSAPGVPRTKDFVPHKIEVKEVIKAEGSLVEWEEKMRNVDGQTTIIDHLGGSLSSHYSIHSIINKIPIVTTYTPSVGDIIEATVENLDINDNDRGMFREAFIVGFNSAPFVYKNMNFKKSYDSRPILLNILELSLATLRNFSGLSLSKDYELLGVVLGLFIRTTFSISAGEARHSTKKSKFSSENKHGKDMEEFFKTCSSNRDICYNTMFAEKTIKCIKDIETIYYIFKDLSWGPNMGGRKWASCTESSIQLFNACVRGDIESTVVMFNRVIDEEHNGGKYLDKLISVCEFYESAEHPSEYALRKLPQIIDILDTARRYKVKKEVQWKKTIPSFIELKIEPLSKEVSEIDIINKKIKKDLKSSIATCVSTCDVKTSKKISSIYAFSSKKEEGLDKEVGSMDLDKVEIIMYNGDIYEFDIPIVKLDCTDFWKYKLNPINNWWVINYDEGTTIKIISKASLTSKVNKEKTNKEKINKDKLKIEDVYSIQHI